MIGKTNITISSQEENGLPEFTYTGAYTLLDDGDDNWRIKFTSSGTLNFTKLGTGKGQIDAFCVGGGGGGNSYRGGGGGGYGLNLCTISKNVNYTITIGSGGSSGSNGADSSIVNQATSELKCIGYGGKAGGTGGSIGGGTGGSTNTTGGDGYGEFATGTIAYGGGGGGFGGSKTIGYAGGSVGGGRGGSQIEYNLEDRRSTSPTSGTANTGGGGGQGSGASGGSGIVVIRNHRE